MNDPEGVHMDPEILGYCPQCLAEDIAITDAERDTPFALSIHSSTEGDSK